MSNHEENVQEFSWIHPSEIERRVSTIPLPKKLKSSFTHIVFKWVRSSGNEWTVGRLKSFKDCLLQSYANGGVKVTHKPEWFATTPSGNLSGVFGRLWAVAMQNEQNLFAVLFLVHIYTGVTRLKSNSTLLAEIKSQIQGKPVVIPKRGHQKVGLTDVFKAFRSMPDYKKWRKRAQLPVPLTLVLPGKESHTRNIHEDVLALAGSPIYGDEERKNLLTAALGAENALLSAKFSTVVGKVHMTHEPGLKTRYFAAPNQVIQRALEPLKEVLLDVARRCPWDCTHDQRKADAKISAALASGETVYSVDMSKATDNFPWKFQLTVGYHLTRGIARTMLDLMDFAVTRGLWIMPDGSRVRWTKGQPLGLGPSFPLFTVSHGILLYILNGYKWDRSFYVLGDDVVIFEHSLYSKYRKVLAEWDIEVSEAKSFASAKIAQFAGVTFTPKLRRWIPKWRPITRASSIDAEAWWYPGLLKGYKEYPLIEEVLALPEPYGIGRNPKGTPLSARLTPSLVDELVERESRREAKAIATATRVDLMPLHKALLTLGDDQAYALTSMLKSQDLQVNAIVLEGHRKHHRTTIRSLPPSLAVLAHGTEVAGYPRLRKGASLVDPYSLGSLGSWKRLLKRAKRRAEMPV